MNNMFMLTSAITRLIFTQAGEYQNYYKRSMTMDSSTYTQNNLAALLDTTMHSTRSNVNITAADVASALPMVVNISDTPTSTTAAHITNGWATQRYRVSLVLTVQAGPEQHDLYLHGYTDYADITHAGTLPDDMEITFTSAISVIKGVVPGYAGQNVKSVSTIDLITNNDRELLNNQGFTPVTPSNIIDRGMVVSAWDVPLSNDFSLGATKAARVQSTTQIGNAYLSKLLNNVADNKSNILQATEGNEMLQQISYTDTPRMANWVLRELSSATLGQFKMKLADMARFANGNDLRNLINVNVSNTGHAVTSADAGTVAPQDAVANSSTSVYNTLGIRAITEVRALIIEKGLTNLRAILTIGRDMNSNPLVDIVIMGAASEVPELNGAMAFNMAMDLKPVILNVIVPSLLVSIGTYAALDLNINAQGDSTAFVALTPTETPTPVLLPTYMATTLSPILQPTASVENTLTNWYEMSRNIALAVTPK